MKTTNETCCCISLSNASSRKRKHNKNNNENKENVNALNNNTNANNKENSFTLNRVVKRLRLNSLSPNVVSNGSSQSYSSMLASAAVKYCQIAAHTPSTTSSRSPFILKNKELLQSHLFLNENSTCSRDSGISNFSPASFEIQQKDANKKVKQLTNAERPNLAKENNFDDNEEEDEFSSNDEDSFESSVNEMDQQNDDEEANESNRSLSFRLLLSEDSEENDEYRNIFNSHKSNRFISNVNDDDNDDNDDDDDDENTRDHFSFSKNVSRQQQQQQQQLNTTSNSHNNSSLSLTGGARRCLFKNSPLNSPSPSYANTIMNAIAANSTPLTEMDQRVILAPLAYHELAQNNGWL